MHKKDSFSQDKVDSFFQEKGFLRFEEHLLSALKSFRITKFAPYDSKLCAINASLQPINCGFVIDFGGTHTRIVQFGIKSNVVQIHAVEHIKNDQLANEQTEITNTNKDTRPINLCFQRVIARIVKRVNQNTQSIKHIAIIWSNAAQAEILKGSVRGITNIVTGINNGEDYLKGEWFIDGLQDGDNLGEIFISECRKQQINLSSLVMGNDTVFVGIAEDAAQAAGVISTGANMASVRTGTWHNLECGTTFDVPNECVSDIAADRQDFSIQSLVAGGWIGERYENILSEIFPLLELDAVKCKQNVSVNGKWLGQVFCAPSFAEQYVLLKELFDAKEDNDEAMYVASKLATIFCRRVIALCAVLICGSVSETSDENIKVILDSRVLEGFDPDFKILKSYMNRLGSPQVSVRLFPEGDFGVGAGVIGAARSLGRPIPE